MNSSPIPLTCITLFRLFPTSYHHLRLPNCYTSSTFPSSPACQSLLIWSCKPYIDENIPKSIQFSYTRIQIHWIHMTTHTFGANWERHPIYPSLLHAPPRLLMAPPCATPHPTPNPVPSQICLQNQTALFQSHQHLHQSTDEPKSTEAGPKDANCTTQSIKP